MNKHKSYWLQENSNDKILLFYGKIKGNIQQEGGTEQKREKEKRKRDEEAGKKRKGEEEKSR